MEIRASQALELLSRIPIGPAKSENKWIIDKEYTEEDIKTFTSILKEISDMIKQEQLKTSTN